MNERRIACILLPDFPLELYGKLHPGSLERPVALVDEAGDTALVAACNRHAAKFDVAVGMTAAQANSHCPGLLIGVRDLSREQIILRRIRHTLAAISPDLEHNSDTEFFLESSRLKKLYPDEPALARKILALLQPLGYPVTLGFAVNKFVARLAAGHTPRNRWSIIPTGTETAWLHERHIAQLPLSENTADTLFDLGITTIGQAAALPANEIIQRFGTEGAALTRRSRGHDPELFLPDRPADDHVETRTLDHPIHGAANILAHIEALLARLLDRLKHGGRSTHEIQIRLSLDNRTEQVFKVSLEKPSVSIASYLRQLRSTLERLRLEAAVRDITLRIPHTATLVLEQTAFEHTGNRDRIDPGAADTITRTLSGATLCTAVLAPAHLPERRFQLVPVTSSSSPRSSASSGSSAALGRSPLDPAPSAEPIPYSLGRIDGLRLLQPPHPTRISAGCHCEERSDEAISPWWPTIYGGSGRSGLKSRSGSEGLQPRETRIDEADVEIPGCPQLAVGSPRQKRLLVGQDPCGPDVDPHQPPKTTPRLLRDNSGAHRITARRGPWKISGDWWHTGFDRLYYELRTDDHRRYLAFFDRTASQWFLQGVYD